MSFGQHNAKTRSGYDMSEPATTSSTLLGRYQRILILFSLGFLVLLLVVVSGIVVRQQSRLLEDALARRASATLEHLASLGPGAILSGNRQALEELSRIAIQTNDDIRGIAFFDLHGRSLASQGEAGPLPIGPDRLPSLVSMRDYAIGPNRIFLGPVTTSYGALLGVCQIRLSRGEVTHAVARAAVQLDAMIVAVFAIVAWVMVFLIKRVKVLAEQEMDRSRELAKAYEDLKQLQSKLVEAEKMSAVGRLAAGVAHEINNPLGIILGFAELMAGDLRPGDPLELAVKSIERESNRCKDLVQDLLTFSRASLAEQVPMDLNEVAGGALTLIQAKARIAKVDVHTVLCPYLPPILGNATQVQQIIINLANNAVDALPNGGTLDIVTDLLDEPSGSWVCLTVMDDGPGIPPDVLPRIFEPFFTTKPVGKGTGLGLSLVYEIVQKHSGTLDVRSRPGRTEFFIKFPVRTAREMEERMLKVYNSK